MSRLLHALLRLVADQEEPVRLPRTTGRWGVCQDCDAPCLLTEHGACGSCGSRSTGPWLTQEAAWRAAGCPEAKPVDQQQAA